MDGDALYSLLDGMEPNCHAAVGDGHIFDHGHEEPRHPCVGYERFDPADKSTWPEVATDA